MHKHIESLIGRLATDPVLRNRFAANPMGLLEQVREQGFELTEVELEALAATDPAALHRFAEALDRRLRKALPAAEIAESETPIQQATQEEKDR